jgi:hypothetical protein
LSSPLVIALRNLKTQFHPHQEENHKTKEKKTQIQKSLRKTKSNENFATFSLNQLTEEGLIFNLTKNMRINCKTAEN